MYERFAERQVKEALSDTPVVLLTGPRRTGKTTLARKLEGAGRTYLTLDHRTTLAVAQADPVGFIRGLDQAIIDEVQRAPELFLAIKKTVDEDYRPGRFLLTGSANVMTLPQVADSLAGRIETIRMLPLARSEIAGQTPTFLDACLPGICKAHKKRLLATILSELHWPEVFPKPSHARASEDGKPGPGPG